MRFIEKYFEGVLWGSRYMVLGAVVSSMLLSGLLFLITVADVFGLLMHAPDYFGIVGEAQKAARAEIVGAIDDFLLATILLIFSLGLYELFISDIDDAKKSGQSSKVLVINNLDDLKSKLTKVILMILVVTFLKFLCQ